jgi:hypothetical protein
MFPVYDPREFFEKFVVRSYQQFLRNELEPLYVKTAVHQANVMAERVWSFYATSAPEKLSNAVSAGGYCRHLVANECADFQLIWDIDDGHKHVTLGRPGRRVSGAAQTGISVRAALGELVVGEAPLAGEVKEYVIVLDDGSVRNLAEVLANVMAMWKSVLARL